MSQSHKPSTAVDASDPQVVERRRPGRIANVSPALIPLLRGSNAPPPDTENIWRMRWRQPGGLYSVPYLSAVLAVLFGSSDVLACR